MLGADERSHLRGAIDSGAEPDRARFLNHRVEKSGIYRTLAQDAAPGGTDFTLVEEHSEQGAGNGGLEIGVGKENAGRLTAELERDSLEGPCRILHHQPARAGTAGEG